MGKRQLRREYDGSDSDAITWYRDGDEDGYGIISDMMSCSQPTGYVLSSDDCNDADAAISPQTIWPMRTTMVLVPTCIRPCPVRNRPAMSIGKRL